MVLECFEMKINQEQAKKIIKKRMSIFGKLLIKNESETEMKTIFIENKIITYTITREPPFFVKWFKKQAGEKKTSKMQMIANGSTAGVAHYDGTGLRIVELEVDDDQVQASDYKENDLVIRGNALARRILRRRVGGHVTIEPLEIKTVYRPYHVMFFGRLQEGNKVRYMPIPADSNVIQKTF